MGMLESDISNCTTICIHLMWSIATQGVPRKNMNLISYMGRRRVQVRKSDVMCLNEVLAIQGAHVISSNLSSLTEQDISDLHRTHRPSYVYCLT